MKSQKDGKENQAGATRGKLKGGEDSVRSNAAASARIQTKDLCVQTLALMIAASGEW